MSNYKKALRECTEGNLRLTRDEHGHELFCYTKSCFFSKNSWNDITMTHRGALYYKGKQVNYPFNKIFNLDEHESSETNLIASKLEKDYYEVYDKANGHLVVLSSFIDDDEEPHQVLHTKGSLLNPENELLRDDAHIFYAKHGKAMVDIIEATPNSTWMFEAIVNHDKHTMWDQQVELYGEDQFVLLGVSVKDKDDNWVDLTYDQFSPLAKSLNFPIVKRHTELETATIDDVNSWFNKKDREGYVIRFSDGHRVKIKTKEYWKLRFKKDLTIESVLGKFKRGGYDRLRLKLPEEIANKTVDVIEENFCKWLFDVYYDVMANEELKKLSVQIGSGDCIPDGLRKEIATSDKFTKPQKKFLMTRISNKDVYSVSERSPAIREEYYEYCLNHVSTLDDMSNKLSEFVDSMSCLCNNE